MGSRGCSRVAARKPGEGQRDSTHSIPWICGASPFGEGTTRWGMLSRPTRVNRDTAVCRACVSCSLACSLARRVRHSCHHGQSAWVVRRLLYVYVLATTHVVYTLGPVLRTPDIKNLGMDLPPERLRTCPWAAHGSRRPEKFKGFRHHKAKIFEKVARWRAPNRQPPTSRFSFAP